MAVILKGFTKSASCRTCPFLEETEWLCLASKRNIYRIEKPCPSWCPVQSLPNNTRIVDFDAAIDNAHKELHYAIDGKQMPQAFFDGFKTAIRGFCETELIE